MYFQLPLAGRNQPLGASKEMSPLLVPVPVFPLATVKTNSVYGRLCAIGRAQCETNALSTSGRPFQETTFLQG